MLATVLTSILKTMLHTSRSICGYLYVQTLVFGGNYRLNVDMNIIYKLEMSNHGNLYMT